MSPELPRHTHREHMVDTRSHQRQQVVESGVMEIALRHQTDAWRVVYVTEIAGRLWVVHAFGKKSKTGIKTPKRDIDLVKARLGRLKRGLLQ